MIEIIRVLHNKGYTLHIASGESSSDLAGYVESMGVHDCFGRLYGPDLIDTFKEGPEYYERIFADLGIAPGDALVVDDSPRAISWAIRAGAQAILVNKMPHLEIEGALHIGGLAELPSVVQTL